MVPKPQPFSTPNETGIQWNRLTVYKIWALKDGLFNTTFVLLGKAGKIFVYKLSLEALALISFMIR
uniref:Uncharacterized protein n=1 Tax=Romanomermis culicivorax TaxID=13658 RepID=A0A915JTB5_ROMCU